THRPSGKVQRARKSPLTSAAFPVGSSGHSTCSAMAGAGAECPRIVPTRPTDFSTRPLPCRAFSPRLNDEPIWSHTGEVRSVSIVRVGLSETKNFAKGYDAIFGGKKGMAGKAAGSPAAAQSPPKKKKKASAKRKK